MLGAANIKKKSLDKKGYPEEGGDQSSDSEQDDNPYAKNTQ